MHPHSFLGALISKKRYNLPSIKNAYVYVNGTATLTVVETNVFTQLSLIIAVGALVSLILKFLKQPLIIAYIITGIIVGPTLLHFVQDEASIKIFSDIGITLLLFIIGMGLNVRVVKEVGKVSGIVGIAQITLTTLIGYGVAFALGYTRTESLLLGVALSFSSTIIILKLLGDKKEQGRLYAKITIGILLIQDIAATLTLIFLTANSGEGFSAANLGWLGLKAIAIVTPLFLVASHILPRMRRQIASSQEFLFLFALAWGFGVATLFKYFGFSIEIGALIAGMSIATTPYASEISSRLRPLRDFFVVVFFIHLGTLVSFTGFGNIWYKVVAFSIVAIVVKPFITTVVLGVLRYTKLTSFKASTALSQVSEFSLVMIILAVTQKYASSELVSVVTLTALVTITLSSYFIIYADKLYRTFEVRLSLFERRVVKADHEYHRSYPLVLFGYKKGGAEFLKTFQSLGKKYIVIDYDPDVIDILDHHNHTYLYGDATDPEFLEELDLEKSKLIVSTMTDFQTNMFLSEYLEKINPRVVFICSADNARHASELYNQGADYVMLPHYIGSERIGAFIKKSGLKKSEFKKFREKHLSYLVEHIEDTDRDRQSLGHAVVAKVTQLSTLGKN